MGKGTAREGERQCAPEGEGTARVVHSQRRQLLRNAPPDEIATRATEAEMQSTSVRHCMFGLRSPMVQILQQLRAKIVLLRTTSLRLANPYADAM